MLTHLSPWGVVPSDITLPENRIDVWRVSLEQRLEQETSLTEILAPDENERAKRFKFAIHRSRFIVARGALRQILSNYLGVSADSLAFQYNNGKPELAGPCKSASLDFNVSHSGELALIAVTQSRSVGIDIEEIRSEVDCLEVARSFFSKREQAALSALPSEKQRNAFFACWTRKEAFLKASGMGISVPLSTFSVSIEPDKEPVLEEVATNSEAVEYWSFANIRPKFGFEGAVVYAGHGCPIHCWDWNSQR